MYDIDQVSKGCCGSGGVTEVNLPLKLFSGYEVYGVHYLIAVRRDQGQSNILSWR